MIRILAFIICSLIVAGPLYAQQNVSQRPDPKISFLKSLAVPGWGHYYVNDRDWNRGKYHLAADAGLLLSYFGLSLHSDNLRQNWLTYGSTEAGVPLEGRSRAFRLAVGNFNSLEDYNDYQKRSRNWDNLYENIPENRWQWPGDRARKRYTDLRDKFVNLENQLPAILGMMVVNRLISGISAYNQARLAGANGKTSQSFYLSAHRFGRGLTANVKVSF